MTPQKTLQEREKELQALLATAAGRADIERLASRYAEATGTLRPARTSAITFILVHEKGQGLIGG